MKTTHTYQIFGDGEIYSSRIKAHSRLCQIVSKNVEDFIPYKERLHERCKGWTEICYPNGYTIVKRPLL